MAKKRITCDFKEFEEYTKKINDLAGSKGLRNAIDDALQKSYDFVTENEKEDIARHTRTNNVKKSKGDKRGPRKTTGRTAKSLLTNEKPEWEGFSFTSINVGYDLSQSLASIFLMYGTPRHGPHPGTAKDTKMYNDIYGTDTRKKVQEIQKNAFESFMKKYLEG